MSKKFKNRVDYIDIAAYGISKIDIKYSIKAKWKNGRINNECYK